jgi:hypothetical protein
MSYGIKIHILDRQGKPMEGIVMTTPNDEGSFNLISKKNVPNLLKLKIHSLTQVSFDKARGNFKTIKKEFEHFITLFMVSDNHNLIFHSRPDLEAFLIFINWILTDDLEGYFLS